MQVLEIYPTEKIIRANRGSTGLVHGVGSTISVVPSSFTIPKSVPYFESSLNNVAYFNPIKAVGFGVTPGVTHTSTFGFGSTTITRSIPTQSIFLPNHKFRNNDMRKQVIGRAQRLGRTKPLNVLYLKYDDE